MQIYPLGFFGCAMHNDHTGGVADDKLARLSEWYDYLEALGVGVVSDHSIRPFNSRTLFKTLIAQNTNTLKTSKALKP